MELPDRRVATTIAAVTIACPLALVGAASAADNGKAEPRGNAYGHAKQEERAQTQAPASSPRGRAHGHSKTKAQGRSNAKAKGQAKAKARGQAKAAPRAGGAGKVTICHATGSQTNPYVTITISESALDAHRAHQGGRDIIPAPAAGCPAGEQKAKGAKDKPAKGKPAKAKQGKVTICHATGSATNPYVTITISESAVDAHRRHQDGRDIIPAPAKGCPPAPARAAGPTVTPPVSGPAAPVTTPTTQVASLAPGAPAMPGAPAVQGVLGETAAGAPNAAAEEAAGVLGAGAIPPAAAPAVRSERGAAGAKAALPFTGLDAWAIVLLGLGALLAGTALARSTRHTRA